MKKKMVDDKYKKVYDVKSLQISLEDYEENHLKQLYDKDALMKTYFNKNFKEIQNYFSTLPKIKKVETTSILSLKSESSQSNEQGEDDEEEEEEIKQESITEENFKVNEKIKIKLIITEVVHSNTQKN